MKTNFSRFGKSAVSVVLSAVMLLSTFLVNAETINNVDSVSDEAVVTDSAAVESSSNDVESADDKSADTTTSNTKKKSAENKLPEVSGGTSTVGFYNILDWDNIYAHYWGGSDGTGWPGSSMNSPSSNNKVWKKTQIDDGNTGIIFNYNDNNHSGYQTGNITNIEFGKVFVPSIAKFNTGIDGKVQQNEAAYGWWVDEEDLEDSFTSDKTVYFKDTYNWGSACAYVFGKYDGSSGDKDYTMNYDNETGLYSTTIDGSDGFTKIIFHKSGWGGHGNQTWDLTLVGHDDYLSYNPTKYLYNNSEYPTGTWLETSSGVSTAKVYAKNGTVRTNGGNYNKYSDLAVTTIAYTDTSKKLKVDSKYNGRVKYAKVERNQEITITTQINEGKYLDTNTTLREKYYVKAFCINGFSHNVIDQSEIDTETGTYTCTYKIKDSDPDVIEITPIFFYYETEKDKEEGNYITFYAEDFDNSSDGTGVKAQWGDTVSAYVWYTNNEEDGKSGANSATMPSLGGYPGQPMVSDGGSFFMQIPKYLNGSDTQVMGVTMNNYYWDDVHREHGNIGNSKYNCQTYDYDDFVALMNYDKTKDIIANFKYGTYRIDNSKSGNNPADRTNVEGNLGQISTGKNNYDLNQFFDSEQKDGNSGNGWKVLVDYYEYPIDLFGNRLKHNDGSYYTEEEILASALNNEVKVNVVSDGYSTDEHEYIGYYATRWNVFENDGNGTGTFKGAMPPSAFINATNATGTAFDKSKFLSYSDNAAEYKDVANRSLIYPSNEDSDKYPYKEVDGKKYYTYSSLANKLFDTYKYQPVVVTFESEIYNGGYNTPNNDPGYRSDVRWYFSKENEKINAYVKIQVVDSKGNIVKINGSDFDAFTSDDSHTGETTTVNAYFTNPTFNEKTYSGLVDQSDSERFEFKADARSKTLEDDKGKYVYVFRGWYFNSGSSVYNQVNDDLYLVTGSSAMNSSGTFVARYEKVYINDSLVVSHELYTNLDTTGYNNPPAKQNGTGTPYVSVRVLKADGSPIVTYPDTTGTITVDPAYLLQPDAAQIEVTLSTVTDDDDTSLYDIYRDYVYKDNNNNDVKNLIASSLQNVNESMSNEKNAGNNNQVIADDEENDVYGVSGKLSDKKLVYTYDINSFLYNISGTSDRNTLTRNEIRYYSDHSILKNISANIIVKYSDNDGKTYTEDSFGNDNSTTTTKLGVTAQFTNSDEDFANKTSTGEITANANKNFEFAVNNNNTYVTDKDGNAYKFVGWYLQTGSGDNTDDSTKLSNTVTGTKAMDNSATFVAKYVKVETLDISHVLLANETNTDAPQAHNGKATPKVTVEFVKDGAETVTFATEQDTTTTPVQIDKDLLKSYEEQGYSLKVTVIADDSSDKLVGAYRYGYGYNDETSTVTETNAYYKSGNQNLETTEDSSKTTDTLATIGDPDTTTANRTTIVYTYDISKLFGTGDDSNTLKVPSLKHITDFGTDKVNIIFKYYDRAMNAADSKPTDINTTPSTTTFKEQIGTADNNVDKIASAITKATAEVNREKLIENVIDDYKFWTTQADAEKSLKGWTDMRRSEKKEDNTPYTYADLDLGDNYKYHTDRYSRVKGQVTGYDSEGNAIGYSLADDDKSGDEQWVTYYSDDACKNAITVTGDDISNSDLYRVKNVVVWGFNYPKTYNVSFKTSLDTSETVGGITIAKAAAKDEECKEINQLLPYYYNQRVGTTIDNNVIDNDTPHLKAYGFASTTGTEITAPDYDDYDFDGWYENVNGNYVKVSSDKSYGNRVTKTTTLYAGYRAEGIKTKGITLTQNDVEHYVTTEGTPRVRYVTMLNAYGFDDSDPNFKKLSLVYVKFANRADLSDVTVNSILANDDLKNAIISKLKEESGKSVDQLTVTISNVTTDESVTGTKEISYTYNIVATPTDGSGDSETSVSTGSIRFTNKNRAQFVMDLKETTVSGDDATSPNLLVFAVVKYADSTIYSNDNTNPYKNEIKSDNGYVYLASDNYVIYQNGEAVK